MKKSKRNFALGILGLTAILIASIGAGYYPKTQIGVNACGDGDLKWREIREKFTGEFN